MICLSNCLGPNSKIELPTSVFFSKNKNKNKLKPKWQLSIRRCRKSEDHAQEDLAKSGCKPDLKYQTLFILLYMFGYGKNQRFAIFKYLNTTAIF